MKSKNLFKQAAIILIAGLMAIQTGCQAVKPAKPTVNSTLSALADGVKYTAEDYKSGIVYEELPDLNAEHSYIVNSRFKQQIVTGVKIGTEKSKLQSLLGKPVAKEGDLALYAFGNLDIGFYGKKTVELAVVRKIVPAAFKKGQLKALIQALSAGKSLKSVVANNPGVFDSLDSRPYLRGNFAHSNGGVEIYEILQTGDTLVNIYSNYKGTGGDRSLKSGSKDLSVSYIKGNNLADDMLKKVEMYQPIENDFKKSGKPSPDRSKTVLNCFRDGACYYLLLRQNDGSLPDRVLNGIYSTSLAWIDSRFLVSLDVLSTIQIIDTKTGKIVAQKLNTGAQDIKQVTGSQILFNGTKGNFVCGYEIKDGKFTFS